MPESAKYAESIEALKADPIIKEMAQAIIIDPELAPLPIDVVLFRFAASEGTPRWAFMNHALEEYHNRGGTIPTHIGGPARAILALVKEAWRAQDQEA
jgi:hypothetical protein